MTLMEHTQLLFFYLLIFLAFDNKKITKRELNSIIVSMFSSNNYRLSSSHSQFLSWFIVWNNIDYCQTQVRADLMDFFLEGGGCHLHHLLRRALVPLTATSCNNKKKSHLKFSFRVHFPSQQTQWSNQLQHAYFNFLISTDEQQGKLLK